MTELLLWVAREPLGPSMVGRTIMVDGRPALVLSAGLRTLEVKYLPRGLALAHLLAALGIR